MTGRIDLRRHVREGDRRRTNRLCTSLEAANIAVGRAAAEGYAGMGCTLVTCVVTDGGGRALDQRRRLAAVASRWRRRTCLQAAKRPVAGLKGLRHNDAPRLGAHPRGGRRAATPGQGHPGDVSRRNQSTNDASARSRRRRGGLGALGAALLRRRPKGLLPAARQELLDPSKAWWGGRRGRLADRPRYSISVSLGVVPLVLPRRGSPSTHRGRGWLRSTRSFRTASAPTKLATRRIRTRAWMKQRYWVAPACTSELHHGRGPGTARPFDDAGGDGTQAPPCRRTRPPG